MSIRAHPSAEALADYAGGSLPTAPGLVIAAHLGFCEPCRRYVRALEEIGGAFLIELEPGSTGAGAPEAAIRRAGEAPRRDEQKEGSGHPATPIEAVRAGVGPRRYFGYRRWLAHVRAPRTSGWRVFLLHAPGGARLPDHGHVGTEFTCVLQGAYHDGDETYGPGDFIQAGPERRHRIEVPGGEACLSIIARQGPVRASGPVAILGRILGV